MNRRRWPNFVRRMFMAAAIAFLVAVVPLPLWTPRWFLFWQVPIVVFLFICYVGKLLIDTIVYPPKKE